MMLLRGGEQGSRCCSCRRTPQARFMGGVWVFPGGAVDAAEGDGDEAHRAAAIRELREEAGDRRAPTRPRWSSSRAGSPRRRSRSASTPTSSWPPLPAGQEPQVDGEECVDLGWFTPAEALAALRGRRASRWCSRRSSTCSSSASSPRSPTCSIMRAAARCSRSSRASCRGRGRADPAPRRPRLRMGPRSGSGLLLRRDHVRDRVDQREMREGLRVVAEMAPR